MLHQLKKKILISGKIELLTGLRIGSSSSAMSIGGLDNIIIRNPLDNKPYIPGSSLKGKMRAMIDLRDGSIDDKGNTTNDPTKLSCKLFGSSPNKNNKDKNPRPSCLIVRDCSLIYDENNPEHLKKFAHTDVPFAEVKTEVSINRITSEANPRQMERVPTGAEFSLNLVINIFNEHSEDNEKELVQTTFDALKLVQDDYLGGSGSRGYGQIKFHVLNVKERLMDFYRADKAQTETDYTLVPVPDALKPSPVLNM